MLIGDSAPAGCCFAILTALKAHHCTIQPLPRIRVDWFFSFLLPFYKVLLFTQEECLSLVPSEYNLPQMLAHWWLNVPFGRPQNDTGLLSEEQTRNISSVEGMQIFYSDNLQLHQWWQLKPRTGARAGCFLTLMKIKRANTPTKSYTFPILFSSVRAIP